jgi:hypothetical protein
MADRMRATKVAQADEPIAVDGKSVRSATTSEQKAPHLLSFCTHHSQEILLQVRVDEKTSQLPRPIKWDGLASGLHRNSAYLARRAALASLSDASGLTDK